MQAAMAQVMTAANEQRTMLVPTMRRAVRGLGVRGRESEVRGQKGTEP
jgi:hypothetical protein